MLDEREETRRVRRPATDHELAEKAGLLVELMRSYEATEREKKGAAEDFNEQLKACDSRISSVREQIESRMVEEETAVLLTFDFGRNSVTVTRKDDATVMEERAMTAEERQARESVPLPLVESSGTPGTTDYKARAAGERDDDVDACDHKFVDSNVCLKCGWRPPARGEAVEGDGDEAR